jgi:hypothetical protein
MHGRRLSRGGSAALCLLLTVGTVVGLTGAAANASAKVGPTTLKAVVSLAPRTSTVGERVTASVNKSTLPKGDKLKRITLSWGDHTKTVVLSSLKAKPIHRYGRAGRYLVVLSVTDQKHKIARHTAAEVVTALSPLAGSYTGTNPQNNEPITFFVSSDRKHLQDIYISDVYLTCEPGGKSITDALETASVALNANGSFSATTTQHGVDFGYPTKFTYTFRGNYQGLNSSGVPALAGTFKETINYTDSAARTCSSSNQSWTATRDTQPAQTAAPPPVGSYTATNPENNEPITFYVSSDRKHLQDVSIPDVYLICAPGGKSITDALETASVAIKANGSFSATTTQHGVAFGYPTTFTYTFRGNFHGLSPSGSARAAGTFRETLTYTDNAARTCTSDDQSWTATRDTQPAQPASAPPDGSYTGTNPENNEPITFYVSSDRKHLQDISIPEVYLICAPGGASLTDDLETPLVDLNSNGSFSATTTQHGVLSGYFATFTYTFRGNVHGVSPSGAARFAGTFRETITYTDTTPRTCTSDDVSWTATRDTQPAQPISAPPAGVYTGTNPQNNEPITFSVSSNQASLQNISIPDVYLSCAPGGASLNEPLSISTAPIGLERSFTATTTGSGTVAGHAAMFTYTFRGNFHGVDPSGAARAAGTFRESVTYTDTTARSCTSDDVSWTASRTS